jgi:hypothetical protein
VLQLAAKMETKPKRRLTAHEERTIAVDALVDPRTVRKAIAGDYVRPMSLARIRAALDARFLGHLLPTIADEKPSAEGGRS